MDSKKDIKDDLKTYCDNKQTPIFHRLKFADVSFYLTKSYFHNVVATGSNGHGYYRIFSWDDWRSKELLGLELGEDNRVHGPVKLVGRFTPADDDLENCQYHSLDGRSFYQSAQTAVGGKKQKNKDSIARGDEWSEFRMGEIIPTGVQGKAIYGDGDYISDGPAGT